MPPTKGRPGTPSRPPKAEATPPVRVAEMQTVIKEIPTRPEPAGPPPRESRPRPRPDDSKDDTRIQAIAPRPETSRPQPADPTPGAPRSVANMDTTPGTDLRDVRPPAAPDLASQTQPMPAVNFKPGDPPPRAPSPAAGPKSSPPRPSNPRRVDAAPAGTTPSVQEAGVSPFDPASSTAPMPAVNFKPGDSLPSDTNPRFDPRSATASQGAKLESREPLPSDTNPRFDPRAAPSQAAPPSTPGQTNAPPSPTASPSPTSSPSAAPLPAAAEAKGAPLWVFGLGALVFGGIIVGALAHELGKREMPEAAQLRSAYPYGYKGATGPKGEKAPGAQSVTFTFLNPAPCVEGSTEECLLYEFSSPAFKGTMLVRKTKSGWERASDVGLPFLPPR